MKHQKFQTNPGNSQHDEGEATTPTTLKNERPYSEQSHNRRNFLFTGHSQNSKNEEPEGAPGIHKIEHKEQQRSGERDRVKVKNNGILLCGIEQIEQSNTCRNPFIA